MNGDRLHQCDHGIHEVSYFFARQLRRPSMFAHQACRLVFKRQSNTGGKRDPSLKRKP